MNRFPPQLSVMLIGLLATGLIGGCSHPRMSLDQFLQTQGQGIQPESATPAAVLAPIQPQPGPANGQPVQPFIPSEAIIQANEASLGPIRLGPGDVLMISVTPGFEATAAVPVRQRVSDQGTIDLPLVGGIAVKGMTLTEVEAGIKQAYVPNHYRQAIVNVELVEPDAARVMVLGEVATPGLIPLRRTERNLLIAVDRAGGSTKSASGRVVLRRLREPNACQALNLRDPNDLRTALAMEPLQSGDMVYVEPAQPNTVFVGGLVVAGGPQVYPTGTKVTALQALAAAGGPRPDLLATEATLIRRNDGKDVHVKLNVDRMARGLEPDFELAAGDILWMPHTAGTRVIEWVNQHLFIGAAATYNASYSTEGAKYFGDLKDKSVGIVTP
jgi:polysaccharide export outer membrane protein